ncbi:peptidase family M48-domain-containing protein [Gloeopeniophorella convolvens]|nr:peptidase family M48-domain-containing protein [Gloeopeniophorella convolvens]
MTAMSSAFTRQVLRTLPAPSLRRYAIATRPSLSKYSMSCERPPHYRFKSTCAPRAPRRVKSSAVEGDVPEAPKRRSRKSRISLKMKAFAGAMAVLAPYVLTHVEHVPETGRRRFIDINPEHERRFCEVAYATALKVHKGAILHPSHQHAKRVHRIASHVLEKNNLGTLTTFPRAPGNVAPSGGGGMWDRGTVGRSPEFGERGVEWSLLVVDDDETIGVKALPGTIIAFTGILSVAIDDDSLAAALSHEFAHIVARHHAEEHSLTMLFAGTSLAWDSFNIPFGLVRFTGGWLTRWYYSREREYEADEIGLMLCAKACFDPAAVPKLRKRLDESYNGPRAPAAFLSTHPPTDARVKRLESLLAKAYEVQQTSSCTGVRAALRSMMRSVRLSWPKRNSS